jgi:hypothetical protein
VLFYARALCVALITILSAKLEITAKMIAKVSHLVLTQVLERFDLTVIIKKIPTPSSMRIKMLKFEISRYL